RTIQSLQNQPQPTSVVVHTPEKDPRIEIYQRNLQTFDGNRNIRALELFTDSFARYFAIVPLSGRSRIDLAVGYLREEAIGWWKVYQRDNPGKVTTWEEFKTTLNLAFYPVDSIRIARDKLASLRQTTSVQVYAEKFRDLELQIPDLAASEKIDKFIRGLK